MQVCVCMCVCVCRTVQPDLLGVCMQVCVCMCVCVCMQVCVYICVCVCRTVQPDLLVVSDGSSLMLTNMAVSSIQDIIPWKNIVTNTCIVVVFSAK